MTRLAPGYGEHRFGETTVTLSPSGADVVLPDGREIEARAAQTGACLLTAVQFGYDGNVAAMVREWSYLHASLCHALGLPHSPTLAEFARGARKQGNDLADAEEQMVAAAMKFLNLWRSGQR